MFLSIFLGTLVLFANAQTKFAHTKTNPTGAVVNTGIDTSSAVIPGYYETLIISPVVTKVSGTVGGTVILQVSATGLAGTWTAPLGDTLTLSNVATNFKDLHLPKYDYIYFRVLTTGTGTMAATVDTYWLGKKTSF